MALVTLSIILSACKGGLSLKENTKRTNDLICELEKEERTYTIVEGYYKGVKEESILITLDPKIDIDVNNVFDYIAQKIESYDQECALLIMNNNDSYLVNRDHTHTFMGELLMDVEKPNADSYTYDKTTKLYYFTDKGLN